jgi:hypothetical protein
MMLSNVNGSQHAESAGGAEMKPMTRRARRAERQRKYVAAKKTQPGERLGYRVYDDSGARRDMAYEGPLPGWLRPLDYKTSGETGAMRVPSKARTWYQGNRRNAHTPPPGQRWDRSGLTYLIEAGGTRLERPIIHHRWRRLRAEEIANSKTA